MKTVFKEGIVRVASAARRSLERNQITVRRFVAGAAAIAMILQMAVPRVAPVYAEVDASTVQNFNSATSFASLTSGLGVDEGVSSWSAGSAWGSGPTAVAGHGNSAVLTGPSTTTDGVLMFSVDNFFENQVFSFSYNVENPGDVTAGDGLAWQWSNDNAATWHAFGVIDTATLQGVAANDWQTVTYPTELQTDDTEYQNPLYIRLVTTFANAVSLRVDEVTLEGQNYSLIQGVVFYDADDNGVPSIPDFTVNGQGIGLYRLNGTAAPELVDAMPSGNESYSHLYDSHNLTAGQFRFRGEGSEEIPDGDYLVCQQIVNTNPDYEWEQTSPNSSGIQDTELLTHNNTGVQIVEDPFTAGQYCYQLTIDQANGGGFQQHALRFGMVKHDIPQVGTIVVTKVLPNDNGGTETVDDFHLYVDGTEVISGVPTEFPAGIYSVSESWVDDHGVTQIGDMYDVTIDCAGHGNFIDLGTGDTAECTVTNDDKTAVIGIVTEVVGGTAVPSDFTVDVTGTNVSTPSFPGSMIAVAVTLDAGSYSITASSVADYLTEYTPGCSGSLANGEFTTCIITNTYTGGSGGGGTDPQPGHMKIYKEVIGGPLNPEDFAFTLTENGVDTVEQFLPSGLSVHQMDDGTDFLIVEVDPTSLGYEASYTGDCSGTIQAKDHLECHITNTYVGTQGPTTGSLTVRVHVVTDDGGVLVLPEDLDVLLDNNGNASSAPGSETGHEFILDPGTFSAGMLPVAGYTISVSGDCGGMVVAGDVFECDITLNDIPQVVQISPVVPSLYCVEDIGDGFLRAHFNYNNPNSDDVTVTAGSDENAITGAGILDPDAGQNSTFYSGYFNDAFVVDFLASDADVDPLLWTLTSGGQTLTASADANSTPCSSDPGFAIIRVIKHVVNDNDGTSVASDFTLDVDANNASQSSVTGSEDGVDVIVSAGDYQILESSHDGYDVSYSNDCSGTIGVDELKICTVTNDDTDSSGGGDNGGGDNGGGDNGGGEGDQTGSLILELTIINDDGGSFTNDQFHMFADSILMEDGEPEDMTPGTYQVTTDYNPDGFTISAISGAFTTTFGGACSSTGSVTVTAGSSSTCTVTIDDVKETSGGGSGNGHTGGGATPTPATPPGQVLGDQDENIGDPIVVETPTEPVTPTPTPEPQVLGDTTEALPRTGFPAGYVLLIIAAACAMNYKKKNA